MYSLAIQHVINVAYHKVVSEKYQSDYTITFFGTHMN